MSARKSSHRTIFLIVSNGSPLALIASSLRSTSKKPVCPMTRSLDPPMAHCGQRVRFVATWREEFFEVPYIDFLRYSDRAWRLLCVNRQDYTNRLRHSDYIRMLHEADYEILQQRKYLHRDILREVEQMPLWGRYRDMSVDELATTWSHLVIRPA